MKSNRDWLAPAGGRAWWIVALAAWAASGVPAAAQAPAAGNAAAGEKAFAFCSACHQVGPTATNAFGPVLNGVVGRPAGSYPGYMYSDANKKSGLTWDEKTLTAYLPDPQKVVPGTTMPVGAQAKDVPDLIAYLKQFDAQGNKKPQ